MLRVLLSPRLVSVHLLAVAAVVAAGWLGLWQYQAWQASREAQVRSLTDADPVPLRSVLGPDQPFPGDLVGRPVRFAGRWVTGSSFYVAGRPHRGVDGYWALTPVAVCDPRTAGCADAPAILVVRGWTGDLAEAPAPPSGAVRLVGWLQPPEGSGIPDEDPGDDVLPEIRIADAIQRVDQDLYGAYVIADHLPTAGSAGRTAGVLTPVTPSSLPEPETFTAWRNLLYALEWWLFGGFAVLVWWRWCRDEVERTSEEVESQDAEVTSRP